MLLVGKTKPERRTIGQCKATNGFENLFQFCFKQTPVTQIVLSYANKS